MVNIVYATSEVVPFAKTGGLADVSAALPVELARLGHQPTVFMPAYRCTLECGEPITPTDVSLSIPIGSKTVAGQLMLGRLPGSDVPVYFVRQDDYFGRNGLYGEGGEDFKDNCERFVFFCRAVMESIRLLELPVDVLHANDWQTGLLPAYLQTEYRTLPGYQQIASLFTIHNLAYQGTFWHWDMLLTGLDWKYFNWHQMEYYGNLNLMKTGLAFADAINAVSPRYAEEIQSAPLGCGLEGVLQHRRAVLSGVVNGVDYRSWNPSIDPNLSVNYGPTNVGDGKQACKAALQKEMGLPERADVPLAGLIGRMVDQKGFDLMAELFDRSLDEFDVQWAILGSGQPKYEELLTKIAARQPSKVAVKIGFSEPLARRIEAGADLFVMPSRYEPCGLNQLYSLKYGAVPLVHETGGLADTIVDASDHALADGTANGFSFHEYSALALSKTLSRAVDMYRNSPDVWRKLVATGINQDWSWSRSANQYVDLYRKILARRRQGAATAGR